jgi:hypothetical protein
MSSGREAGNGTWCQDCPADCAENRHPPLRAKGSEKLAPGSWLGRLQSETVMRGFITEQHFEQAEVEFPGIRAV